MSETNASSTASDQTFGVLAQYKDPESLMHACAKVRDAGFQIWDAHTPFPIHGLQQAMGIGRSWVSAFCLVMGLSGAALGMLMQLWVATYGYAIVISGKPFFGSWPAFVPITFECGVLGGASGAILGFLIMSRLPQHHHPLFNSDRFAQVTDDGFFISIESSDPKFDADATQGLLRDAGATHVELVAA